MGNIIKRISFVFSLVIGFFACNNSTIDPSGYFYTTDKINTRFDQSEQWNSNHPFKKVTSTTENYQLMVAADIHVGPMHNLELFLNEAKKPENLAYVLVGDVVTGKAEDYMRLDSVLPRYTQKPGFIMVGNHDLFFEGWDSFFKLFGSSIYYFTVQTPSASDLYICLDSGSGTLGDKQLAWLKNVLATVRPNCRNCVVFTHVNFFRNRHTGSTNPLAIELEVMIDLFFKSNVNLVLMGHDHERSLNQLGYTTYVTMDALLDGHPKASWVKLNVSGDKVGYSFEDVK
jgi:predicted phosphodiesterase